MADDAIDLLIADHRTVDGLFKRFESAAGDTEREQVVRQLITELSVHAGIEEKTFYPVARQAIDDGDEEVDEGLEEHRELKETLRKLDGMAATDPEFESLVRTAKEEVEHHVSEEEGQMFPKVRDAVPQQRLDELGAQMAAEKSSAPTHPD